MDIIREKIPTKIIRVLVPLIIYIAVTFVSALSFSILLSLLSSALVLYGFSGVSEPDIIMLVNSASALVVSVILWILYNNDKKLRVVIEDSDALTDGDDTVKEKGLLILCGLLVCIFGNYLINLLPVLQMSESFQEVNDAISNSNIIVALVSTIVVAPISEELLIRGLFFRRLRDYNGFIVSALISSAVFGVIHMNIVQGIYAFVAGMAFAFIYERYQSVKASMICHAAANAGSFLLGILFLVTGESRIALILVIAVSLLLLIAVLRLIYIKVPYRKIVYIRNITGNDNTNNAEETIPQQGED